MRILQFSSWYHTLIANICNAGTTSSCATNPLICNGTREQDESDEEVRSRRKSMMQPLAHTARASQSNRVTILQHSNKRISMAFHGQAQPFRYPRLQDLMHCKTKESPSWQSSHSGHVQKHTFQEGTASARYTKFMDELATPHHHSKL